MLGVNQNVVGEVELFQRGNASKEFWLQQEAVRFALYDVANPDQLGISRKGCQLRLDLRRQQVDPADDTQNERRIPGQIEEPLRLFQRLPCLNCNASLKPIAIQLGLQIAGKEIATQRCHRIVNPFILAWIINPEVLMSVN